jgi:hypothetical protein
MTRRFLPTSEVLELRVPEAQANYSPLQVTIMRFPLSGTSGYNAWANKTGDRSTSACTASLHLSK